MSYLVLARKWRPKSFQAVVGQQHVLRALINGLDQNRLHHAFLFAGTRGVGKTTLARIFAKSLNCEQGVSATPCGECQSCQEVDNGRFVDLIEVDAASRTKVDDTRELLDNVQYAPSRGRYKVYLIDEVHMLSTSSFNALLKTLEEPPPHVKFLFATTDPQKLPVTILSRCMQFNLRRLDVHQISHHLRYLADEENIPAADSALQELARAADGSMRDALSLMDQAIAYSGGEITADAVFEMLGSISQDQLLPILTALMEQDGQQLITLSQELSALGRDFEQILDDLMVQLQQIASLQVISDMDITDRDTAALMPLVQGIDAETVQLFYQIALHGKRDLPLAADPHTGFEMTLLRMLSFRPQTAATGVTPAKKPQPQPDTVPAAAPDSVSESTPETTESATKITTAESSQADEPIAPSPAAAQPSASAEPVPNTPQSTASPAEKAPEVSPTVDLDANQWPELIARLKLSALTRQLAENSAFVAAENQQITLALQDAHRHLATEKTIERLQAALGKVLNTSVSLQFTDAQTDSETAPTLASQRADADADRLTKARESIANDPTLAMIKKTFNARIIESTIKPLDQQEDTP